VYSQRQVRFNRFVQFTGFIPEIYAEDILVYGSRTDYAPHLAASLADTLKVDQNLAVVVDFDSWGISGEIPSLLHALDGPDVPAQGPSEQTTHRYANVASPGFVVPGHLDFRISTAGVAHTRSLEFLKRHLGGPYFDLEAIWDEHTYYEFGARSVDKTMATMVQEPYVNHVPTVRATPKEMQLRYTDQI